jgi:tetratricopeptide (TPR) repeat protein
MASPHYNRGRVLMDLHRYDEARPELEQACRLAPDFSIPFYLLALAEAKLSEPENAIGALQKLIALQPRDADAYFLLGQSLQKVGRMPEAIAAWKKALEIDPGQSEALYNLLRNASKTNPEEAKAYKARFAALQEQNQAKSQAETLTNFGLASAKRGDYAQAIGQLRDALRECGECVSKADLHKDLGIIECQSGDVETGQQDLLKAKALKPQDPDTLKALAVVSQLHADRAQP